MSKENESTNSENSTENDSSSSANNLERLEYFTDSDDSARKFIYEFKGFFQDMFLIGRLDSPVYMRRNKESSNRRNINKQENINPKTPRVVIFSLQAFFVFFVSGFLLLFGLGFILPWLKELEYVGSQVLKTIQITSISLFFVILVVSLLPSFTYCISFLFSYLTTKKEEEIPELKMVASMIGIKNFSSELDSIEQRLKSGMSLYQRFAKPLVILFFLLFWVYLGFNLVLFRSLIEGGNSLALWSSNFYTLILFLIVCFMFLAFFVSYYTILVLGAKFIAYFFYRQYAQPLAVQTLLHLLIDLQHSKAVSDHHIRTLMIRRMSSLIRYTRVIGLKSEFLVGQDSSLWVNQHFKEIESYIRERQRWLTAPQGTTALELKKDFTYLLPIFITGRYGEFRWHGKFLDLVEKKVSKKNAIWNRLGFLKWIIAALPIVILIVLMQSPKLVLGDYPEDMLPNALEEARKVYDDSQQKFQLTIFYVAISWCLLLFDKALNLGIVDSIVKFAQGIKEINK